MTTLLTVGHGKLERDALRDLLQSAGVQSLVDIRRFPGSRANPDVARDAMARWLPERGIGYRWEPRLGGRRRLPAQEAGRVEAGRGATGRGAAGHGAAGRGAAGHGETGHGETGHDSAGLGEDGWWTVTAFRAYAAHTRSGEWQAALGALLAEAEEQRVAVMCSESVWWRCHRRLVADVVALAHGVQVRNLMPDGRLVLHQVADGARLRPDGLVVWDGRAGSSANVAD